MATTVTVSESRQQTTAAASSVSEHTPPSRWLTDVIAENGGKKLFSLPNEFLGRFRLATPPFGFNGLGYMVYRMTYSRPKPDGTQERWVDTIQRVVEGTFEILKVYRLHVLHEPWNEEQEQLTAQDMFTRLFEMKFLPPGRGLWAMGTAIIREKGLGVAINSCGFVTTELNTSTTTHDYHKQPWQPFKFALDMGLLGVGIGFDTRGAGQIRVFEPKTPPLRFTVEDSREGWVASLQVLLQSYFVECSVAVQFDCSQLRPCGAPVKTFGGISSGPEPLKALHRNIAHTLAPLVGQALTVTAIVDLMNFIGKCVDAGNIRRVAQISFGSCFDTTFLDLKNYDINPHRMGHGSASNNTVLAEVGMDYSEICRRIVLNGEPGLAWLQNMKAYSRMGDPADYRDKAVLGGAPCLDQSLENMELCCLVETFPARHETLEDFCKTLEHAFLYAKAVTLVGVHWERSWQVMSRNRRIGCSVSGIAQFLASHTPQQQLDGRAIPVQSLDLLKHWLQEGYKTVVKVDQKLSTSLQIPQSIKRTCVKPSGTVSLLSGATPGTNFPESPYYLRRLRMSKEHNPLLDTLRQAGYRIEPAVGAEQSTVVVAIPVCCGKHGIVTLKEVSMWEQLEITALLQAYWADNQVSTTITFDPVTEGRSLPRALEYFQHQLKGVAFLPKCEYGAYPQMPYEAIDEATYHQELSRIVPLTTLLEDVEGAFSLLSPSSGVTSDHSSVSSPSSPLPSTHRRWQNSDTEYVATSTHPLALFPERDAFCDTPACCLIPR